MTKLHIAQRGIYYINELFIYAHFKIKVRFERTEDRFF